MIMNWMRLNSSIVCMILMIVLEDIWDFDLGDRLVDHAVLVHMRS